MTLPRVGCGDVNGTDQARSWRGRRRDPVHSTVVALIALQVTLLLTVIASAVVAFAEVAEGCRDLFTGRSELRGEGMARLRIVPGAAEIRCETPTGQLAVPLNGAAACVFFAGVGLLFVLVLAVAYRAARRDHPPSGAQR